MNILEIIQKRRTYRVPFEKSNIDSELKLLLEIASISPSGTGVDWKLIVINEDKTKEEIAQIVDQDFFRVFQKDKKKFREVFSAYPRWLRFSRTEAHVKGDGIFLRKMPFFMKYIYKILLGPKLGPLSGKMGIMNRESKIFRKNLMASGALIGVFHKKQKERSNYASLIDTGAMLQNLRLCATALGLAYQDQGWITATGSMREKVRELFKMPAEYQPINFFRIGRADKKKLINQDKQSAFRRSLETIVHYNLFNNKNNKHQYFDAKGLLSIFQNTDYDNSISDIQINQIIEAARWSPTGFNVQPFEYVILNESGFIKTILKDKAQANDYLLLVIENHLRQDPDPGPCEILARGAVLQNIRLVAKDIGILITEIPFNKTNVSNNENPVSREILSALNFPEKYSLTFMLSLKPV